MKENNDSILLEIDIKREKLRNIPSQKRRTVIKDYGKFIYTIVAQYHYVSTGDYGWHNPISYGGYLDKLNDYLELFETT